MRINKQISNKYFSLIEMNTKIFKIFYDRKIINIFYNNENLLIKKQIMFLKKQTLFIKRALCNFL